MIVIQEQKPESEPHHDGTFIENASDLPPEYDALSFHHSTNDDLDRYTGASAPPFTGPNGGTPRSHLASLNHPVLDVDKSLPSPPLDNIPSTSRDAGPLLPQRLQTSKTTSWLSLLPFASSFSTKRARRSALSTVNDLVLPLSRASNEGKNPHEILASVAETCAQHKVSLSGVLQEAFIADHTPMYWAIVHYRQELLVALLIHSRPLSIQAISDIRRACLLSSNQALFHALRVCQPPFQGTDGIQVPSLRTASNNLLLGDRPLDEIHVQHTSDGFIASFDVPLWQRRMKAIGQVDIEFIASGRMWSVTFFSTDPSLLIAASGKSKKSKKNTWHVMINLLESSSPTFFNSDLIMDVPSPVVPRSTQTPRLREARSTPFLPLGHEQYQNRSSMYDHHYDAEVCPRPSRSRGPLAPSESMEDSGFPLSSLNIPPPTHPLQGPPPSSTPAITIHLGCGRRKLGRRAGSVELMEAPTTKPDTWSDHGAGYTNAVVSPLGEAHESLLLSEPSQYLLPDGTLRARLEARLVKIEPSRNCIIC